MSAWGRPATSVTSSDEPFFFQTFGFLEERLDEWSASTNLENSNSAVAWDSRVIARNVFPATLLGMTVGAAVKGSRVTVSPAAPAPASGPPNTEVRPDKHNSQPGIGTRHNEKIGHGREKWFAGGGIPTSTAGKLSPEELPACRISSAASRKEERQAQA